MSVCWFLPERLYPALVRLWISFLPIKDHVRLSWVNRRLKLLALDKLSWGTDVVHVMDDMFRLFHLFQDDWDRNSCAPGLLDPGIDPAGVEHLDGIPLESLFLKTTFARKEPAIGRLSSRSIVRDCKHCVVVDSPTAGAGTVAGTGIEAKASTCRACHRLQHLTFNGTHYYEIKSRHHARLRSESDSDEEENFATACARQILTWGTLLFDLLMDVPNLLVPDWVQRLTIVLEIPVRQSHARSRLTFPAERKLPPRPRNGVWHVVEYSSNWVAAWRRRDPDLPVSPFELAHDRLYEEQETVEAAGDDDWDRYGERAELQRRHFEWLSVHDARRFKSVSGFVRVSHEFECPSSGPQTDQTEPSDTTSGASRETQDRSNHQTNGGRRFVRTSFTIRHVLACVEMMMDTMELGDQFTRFQHTPRLTLAAEGASLVCRLWRSNEPYIDELPTQ